MAERRITAFALVGVLALAGCGGGSHHAARPASHVATTPGGLAQVSITADAARRIGLRTAAVTPGAAADPGAAAAISYAAVLYAANGRPYTYVSTGPLTFVRTPLTIDRITGGTAYLKAGPKPGARVVTVGADELYGAEEGVRGEG